MRDGAAVLVAELPGRLHHFHPSTEYNRPMATTTPELHDALVKAGIDRQAAHELMRRVERRSGPSAMSILVGAVIGGFGLLAIGIGWVKSDIEALDARVSAMETSVSERLTRIETILEERLPARR